MGGSIDWGRVGTGIATGGLSEVGRGGGRDFLFGTPSEQRSRPVVDPALLSPEQISATINQFLGMAEAGPNLGRVSAPTVGPAATPGRVGPAATPAQLALGIEQSPFFQLFRSALTDRFTPTSAENQLLSNIMDQTSAQFARRGLGASPIAASSTAASIAPALVSLRQQQIENLSNALSQTLAGQQLGLTQRGQNIETNLANLQAGVTQRGQDVTTNLGNLQAGVTQRGQTIDAGVTQRGQDLQSFFNTLQGLQNILQFGLRNPVGQQQTGTGAQGPIGGLINPVNVGFNFGAGGGGGGGF